MPAITFEHKLTKFEVDNHCILLRDDKKTDFGKHLNTQNIVVLVDDKQYVATVNEFYVDGKFQQGIHFSEGTESAFIVEQTLFPGHTATITLDDSKAAINGRVPVAVHMYVRTKS